MLTVYKTNKDSLTRMFDFRINGKIMGLLKIPLINIIEPRAGRDSHCKEQDYLFVITADFNCILLTFKLSSGVEVVSSGNISDTNG